mgnify:CR=1 FL=1
MHARSLCRIAAISTPSSLDAATLDDSSRLSLLADENAKTGGKSDESGRESSEDESEKEEIPKVKDKKEATEIFKELLKEKVTL